MSVPKLFHNKLAALFPRAEFVEGFSETAGGNSTFGLPYTSIPPDRDWIHIEYTPTQINVYVGEMAQPLHSILLSDPELEQKLRKAVANAVTVAAHPNPDVHKRVLRISDMFKTVSLS
jgi:hypothetical protein